MVCAGGMQRDISEAESLFAKSLEMRERCLGQDHPDVSSSLNNMAEVLRCQNKFEVRPRLRQNRCLLKRSS